MKLVHDWNMSWVGVGEWQDNSSTVPHLCCKNCYIALRSSGRWGNIYAGKTGSAEWPVGSHWMWTLNDVWVQVTALSRTRTFVNMDEFCNAEVCSPWHWFYSTYQTANTRRWSCCFNAGPPSTTLAQHWNHIGLAPGVSWEFCETQWRHRKAFWMLLGEVTEKMLYKSPSYIRHCIIEFHRILCLDVGQSWRRWWR